MAEAKRRGIATYETEDIIEEAVKMIGPKRAKEILKDIVKSGADKEFRALRL